MADPRAIMEWLTVLAILVAIAVLLGVCLLLAQRSGITSWPHHHAKPTPSATATHHRGG